MASLSQAVLVVSPDPHLGTTRCALLQSAGMKSEACSNFAEALQALGQQHWQAVLVCHSYSMQEKVRLLEQARQKQTRSVLLHNFQTDNSLPADAHFSVVNEPGELVKTVAQLLKRIS